MADSTVVKGLLEARLMCLKRGIRTIGYDFQGQGDDGAINCICLPTEAHLSLYDVCKDENPRSWDVYYPHMYKDEPPLPDEGLLQGKEIARFVASVSGLSEILEQAAYDALEQFNGDWVNEDGGGGAVGIDLQTLDFYIDGYQNIVTIEEESAISDGNLAHDDGSDDDEDDAPGGGDWSAFTEALLTELGIELPVPGSPGVLTELSFADIMAKELGVPPTAGG